MPGDGVIDKILLNQAKRRLYELYSLEGDLVDKSLEVPLEKLKEGSTLTTRDVVVSLLLLEREGLIRVEGVKNPSEGCVAAFAEAMGYLDYKLLTGDIDGEAHAEIERRVRSILNIGEPGGDTSHRALRFHCTRLRAFLSEALSSICDRYRAALARGNALLAKALALEARKALGRAGAEAVMDGARRLREALQRLSASGGHAGLIESCTRSIDVLLGLAGKREPPEGGAEALLEEACLVV